MAGPNVVLHQFLYSHYNEKARWGLDWKGVRHERRTHLPGPHGPLITRLSGQTQTPVLVIDGNVIAGSAGILDELERRFPERPLFPADPGLRAKAAAICDEFDREIGVAARTVLFSELIHEPTYMCGVFAEEKPWAVRALYRLTFPLARGFVARGNGLVDPANVARSFEVTERALDRVARETGATGHVVGDTFTIADLTCASLLAILTAPPHPDMHRPEPVPERVAGLLARWEGHPAIAWVNETYRRHRPPRACV